MKYSVFFLLFPFLAVAQISVRVAGVTNTQAVLRLTGYSGACTMTVRQTDSAGPVHPDWSGILDSAHPLTTTGGSAKFLVVGQKTGDKALRAATQYYYAISGCGTASGTFVTKPTILGAISHKQPKNDPNSWNGLDYPAVDLSYTGRDKWYTHPVTGIPMRIVTQPEDFSWMDSVNQVFVHATGGVSWTNFANIVNGSTSTAQTTTTDPVFLYNNIIGQAGTNPWGTRNVENMGVVVFAQCVSGTGTDCDIELGLFTDPAVLPEPGTNLITVRAGGTFVQVTGTHPTTGDRSSTLSAAVTSGTAAYPGGTVDGTTGFPRPHFKGWGNFTLTQDKYVRNGTISVNVTGSDLVINGGLTFANYFPTRALKVGQMIFVAGSGAACSGWGVNDICTIAGITDPTTITVAEGGLPAGVTTARPLPWGLMVRKKTATGTVRIGLNYRNSGHFAYTTGTNQPKCHPVSVTRSDGVKGRICLVPRQTFSHAWFVSEDGELSVPLDGIQRFGGDIVGADFNPADARELFLWHATNGLWKYHYNGDFGVTPTVWQKDPGAGGARYAFTSGGTYPTATWSDPYWTATQTMVASAVGTQITAQYSDQVSAPYPAWGTGPTINFSGMTGGMIAFYRLLEGQDTGPCQVAMFDAATGTLTDFINTATTTNTEGKHIFGNLCHSIQVNPSLPNTFFSSMNIPQSAGSTALLLRGPHVLQITGVMRGGSFSSNTCLEWPPGTSVAGCTVPADPANYDKTCPAVGAGANQIPQAWYDAGAQGNNCVTLRVSGTTAAKAVCSQAGNDPSVGDDLDIYGACEWNATSTWSGGPPLEKGQRFVHLGLGGAAPGDAENFRILTVANTGDGVSQTIVVQRNSTREYCCAVNNTVNPPSFATSPVAACGIDNTRMIHTGSWTPQMVAGAYGCNQPTFYTTYPVTTDKASRIVTEVPISLAKGHSAIGRTGATSYRYLGTGSSRDLATFSELQTQPPPLNRVINAKFNGMPTLFGTYVQQYLSQTQIDISDTTNKYFSGDANHMNGTSGLEFNVLNGGLGALRTTYVQSVGLTDTWRITVAGTSPTDIKNKPLVGWCGPYGLTDISSPATGPIVDSMNMFQYCVAYKNDQCRTGSVPGQTWVKCPNVYRATSPQTAYYTGLEFVSLPSVLAMSGNAGFTRRFRSDIPDESGTNQMLVSDVFKPAGTQYAFWSGHSNPGGTFVLSPSAGYFQGVRQLTWLMKVPKFPLEGEPSRAGGLKRMEVKLGTRSGVTHARIRFGNTPTFQCNRHYGTACLTDASLTPYAFSDDTLTNQSCSSGCTLVMNVWPDEILWYQIETSTNGGSSFSPDPVQVLAP